MIIKREQARNELLNALSTEKSSNLFPEGSIHLSFDPPIENISRLEGWQSAEEESTNFNDSDLEMHIDMESNKEKCLYKNQN